MEGAEHATTDPRIQKLRQATEQAAGPRPTDVVEIARDDGGLVGPGDLAADDDKLGIAPE
jgi:hypothetical protein